jgi:hypothetical protein
LIGERPPSTLRNVNVGSREVPELKIQERPPSMLRNLDGGPREVLELVIRDHPLSTLRNVNGGPPGGAEASDPRAPTINTKKRRRRARGRCQS